jgi:2-polyprenyl-3-methyl-5-hydroxy-6-metoxy-1,4-benzoquinol methylase
MTWKNIRAKLQWRAISQREELKFHRKNEWRNTAEFREQTDAQFEAWGFSKDSFVGKTIIDIGCGSKLKSLFFENSRIIAIDPLANDFMETIEWADLKKASAVHSLPAETFIDELKDQGDLVMCINVLDHCFDPEKVVQNIHAYLKPGGLCLMSVDISDRPHHPNPKHPSPISEEKLLSWFAQGSFKDLKILARDAQPHGLGKSLTLTVSKSED